MGEIHRFQSLATHFVRAHLPPWTPLPSAANMRSVHTVASTQSHFPGWVSVSLLVVSDTVDTPTRCALSMPWFGLRTSTFLPRFPVRGLCCPALYHGALVRFRVLFAFSVCRLVSRRCRTIAPMASIASICSTIKALTAAPLHLQRSSPCLSRANFRPFRPQPLDAPAHRFVSHLSVYGVFRVSPFARKLTATSRRIGFVSYGPVFHLRLLSTLPHGNAVTFDYGAMAFSDTDSHRAVHAPSQAHVQCPAVIAPYVDRGLRPSAPTAIAALPTTASNSAWQSGRVRIRRVSISAAHCTIPPLIGAMRCAY